MRLPGYMHVLQLRFLSSDSLFLLHPSPLSLNPLHLHLRLHNSQFRISLHLQMHTQVRQVLFRLSLHRWLQPRRLGQT